MLIFKDAVTDSKDELFSDAFPMKVIDDILIEVDCQTIVIKKGADVNIGANPSAEEQEDALEDGAESVNNIVYSFRLQSTTFDSAQSYLKYLRGYMKRIKTHLEKTSPDRVQAFEKGATVYAKKIMTNFKDYDLYTGESMDPDGMIALLNYREDGITPFFTFWKDGLIEDKQ